MRDSLSLLEWAIAHAGSQVRWRGQVLDAFADCSRNQFPPATPGQKSKPGLIITADDFGLHVAVNEAVELAHRDGVLTAASLMVGAPATAEAVALARRLPRLRVGLHLVLVDGKAILPRSRIPALVASDGRFHDRMGKAGLKFFLLPSVRHQLEAEIPRFTLKRMRRPVWPSITSTPTNTSTCIRQYYPSSLGSVVISAFALSGFRMKRRPDFIAAVAAVTYAALRTRPALPTTIGSISASASAATSTKARCWPHSKSLPALV